jgi:hypothetical protein
MSNLDVQDLLPFFPIEKNYRIKNFVILQKKEEKKNDFGVQNFLYNNKLEIQQN